MAIFAHPDDEGAIGGTLAHYANNGDEVILICTTRGEVGQISDPSLATRETIGEVRQKELETACEMLGIQHLEFLDYRDSGMDGTEENNDPRAFIQADPSEAIDKIISQINHYQPDIVVTFEPFGWYGHPDHQITSTWVTQAFNTMTNGADAHKPKALFYAVIPFSKFRGMIEQAIADGLIPEEGFGVEIPEEQQLATEAQVTHILDIGDYFDTKLDAQQAHRTQFGEDSPFNKIPRDMMRQTSGEEYFIQVYPDPDANLRDNPHPDLFTNL